MPLTVPLNGLNIVVTAGPLTGEAFAPFGAVVENPRPDLHPSRHPSVAPGAAAAQPLPFDAVSANQGSAIKYQHVTRMLDLYGQAPSGAPGAAVMNMFVCASRPLQPRPVGACSASSSEDKRPGSFFGVAILERHPFTTQTFIPLAAHPEDAQMRYLVVVAPSLPPSDVDATLPVPSSPDASASARSPSPSSLTSSHPSDQQQTLPGRGLPDLRGLRAFVATAGQAVTYGAGTWHAPMVALGPEGSTLDFVVVQFANGIGVEDCQEVVFSSAPSPSPSSGGGGGGVSVQVPQRPKESKL
jgi:ureidoglycolate lyase